MTKLTNEEVLKRFFNVHNDLYDYNLVDYKNRRTKVKIICKKHGVFEQLTQSHYLGKGCPKCGDIKTGIYHSKNSKELIEQCRLKYDNKFDYSKVNNKVINKKTIIICKKHGEFKQSIKNHFKSIGCPQCLKIKRIKSNESFIKEAQKVWGNKFDYKNVNYIKNNKKVELICPSHGSFLQAPNHHLNGNDCFDCATKFNKSDKYILYYISFILNKITYYKIGITKNIKKRFPKSMNIKILSYIEFNDYNQSKFWENKIIKNNKQFIINKKIIKNGNTEIFTKDIFNGDYPKNIYFSSDQHFLHYNILKYCKRPFNSEYAMNDYLIKNINLKVGKNDFLYIIGDVSAGLRGRVKEFTSILQLINCKNLVLVRGNHDHFTNEEYIEMGFKGVNDYLKMNDIFICHYPLNMNIRADWISDKERKLNEVFKNSTCEFIVHGHSHTVDYGFKKLNVGVDMNNYEPISLVDIKEQFKNWELRKERLIGGGHYE